LNSTDKLTVLLNEARSMGVDVLQPDVNEGDMHFAPARGGKVIRFGMAAIKGVGEAAVESILKARGEGGAFKSFSDMLERVDLRAVNKKAIEALIKSGACDCFGETRATLFASIDRVVGRAASAAADKARGQVSLFGMLEERAEVKDDGLLRVPEWSQSELLSHEKELLGFYITGHPLTPFAPILEKYALANSKTASAFGGRTMTRLGGIISAVQQGMSKKSGRPYATVTLEDLEGSFQMVCVDDNYDRFRALLQPNAALLIVGEVNNEEGHAKIFPTEVMPLDDAPRKYTEKIHLRIAYEQLSEDKLRQILDLVQRFPGKCELYLCVRFTDHPPLFIQTHDRYYVSPSREFQKAVDDLLGEDTYYARVDTKLPEKVKRVWERKADPALAGN
jgi:DNA polymerase-3 subunit alpha